MEVETPAQHRAPPQPCKSAGATRPGGSCGSARLLRNPAIPEEAREFGFGRTGYYLLLAGSAATYQCFFLGTIGAIFFGSALLAGVVMTVLIPVTEVLAVLLFSEPFNGTKGVALALSLWGFVSYFYGEVQTAKANSQPDNNPPNAEHLDP
ncbi:purine permease 3-like isoform X1 [Panicum miliaceum]|uniref:Purine permease 3-like isoform X1 n=1 Tax=Panicum miliaceum TaxID=4540 RepID=A0A3L6QSU2_PANMI|nr:purine permease 3-like isoform X1 [Panicum miliaceum]